MDRLQLVSIVAAAGLLLTVLELVRRRRLLERYALLWLLAAIVIMVLAVWRGALNTIADLFGIVYAPNSIFFIAVGFIVLLLLHFSAAVSRLTDQSKVLAQRLSLLEERVRDVESDEQEPVEADADYEQVEPYQRFVR